MAPARFLIFLLLGASLLALSGCGKKGPLVPPEALAPAPVSDLSVAQKGGRFQVTWSAPSKQEGGAALHDGIEGFLLFRRVVLPPAEDCEECASAYNQLARIDLEYPEGVLRLGNKYLFEDIDLVKGKTYQYKVRAFTAERAEGKDSNKARHTVIAPPPPPVVEALSTENGIELSFVALTPEEGTRTGYNIYRSKAGEQMPLIPINAKPVTENKYEDKNVLIDVRYNYAVTSVVTLNGETVESVPSNVVEGALPGRD